MLKKFGISVLHLLICDNGQQPIMTLVTRVYCYTGVK